MIQRNHINFIYKIFSDKYVFSKKYYYFFYYLYFYFCIDVFVLKNDQFSKILCFKYFMYNFIVMSFEI